MQSITMHTLQTVSAEFSLSEDMLIQEGLKAFLEKKLREVKVELFRIHGKYRVASVEELEHLFTTGEVEEKDALDDYHKLDHLEFKREEIQKLLRELQ
jgi:hypothetical protein